MEEKIEETTEKNPEERETSEKETPKEEEGSVEKPKEMSEEERSKLESFDRIYAEMKESKAKVKGLEEEIKKMKEREKMSPEELKEELKAERIIEITSAFEGLDPIEKKELMVRARALGVDFAEARKDSNFLLWQKAYKEKQEKGKKIPEPSSPASKAEIGIERLKEIEWEKETPPKEYLKEHKKLFEEAKKARERRTGI